MTEPTDDEIVALADATRTAEGGANGYILPISFARAVLAKWGAQPAVVGEPVAWLHDCAALLTNDVELWINACPHCGKPRTLPQPTQAQAGAVPLTDEQIDAAAKKLAECMEYPWEYMPEPGRKNMRKHAQAVLEAAHGIGIKGGQHGAE